MMEHYRPEDLKPPQLAKNLTTAQLEEAGRFIAELIEWRKTRE